MPQSRLTLDDGDFIMNMKKVEYNNREIAKKPKVCEGTIRYRIKRRQSGREDGRNSKPSVLDCFRAVIDQWIKDYEDSRRWPTLKTLYSWLVRDHGYERSYYAFRRYVSKHYPELHKKGAWIRIETPPGAELFVDWREDVLVQMGGAGFWVKIQVCSSSNDSDTPLGDDFTSSFYRELQPPIKSFINDCRYNLLFFVVNSLIIKDLSFAPGVALYEP
jgi:hypothetical protein